MQARERGIVIGASGFELERIEASKTTGDTRSL